MWSTKPIIRFGQFEVDLESRQLQKNGFRVRLPEQSYQLLMVLLERPGEVVTRDELRQRLWPSDVVIDFDRGLNKSVQKLREALGDSAEKCSFIETRQRVGYRFVAPVQGSVALESPASTDTLIEDAPAPPGMEARPTPGHRSVLLLLAVALLCLAGVGAWWVGKHFTPTLHPIRSLAVLPLENLSGDNSQDYIADGMTDELITELARTPDLRVVSRTSTIQATREHLSLPELARALDVDAVVEGSVVRSGDKVRINAQLIDASTDKHIWAQSFESQSGDLVSLQDNVAREIAEHTKATFARSFELHSQMRVDPAAYDAYLRGRYFNDMREADKSAAYFQEAIRIDPNYSSAYAGLADALESKTLLHTATPEEAMPKALAAAQHAIALDPQNGEAYASLGGIETTYQWNWAAAERDLTRAIVLNPGYSFGEMRYAVYLDAMGRTEDAVTHMRRAVQLDPISFLMNRHLGSTLYFARRYDEALFYLQRAGEMEKQSPVVENWLSWIYERKGMHDQAVLHDQAYLRSHVPQDAADRLQAIYQAQGWHAYWQARMSLIEPASENNCGNFLLGKNAMVLGDTGQAFDWLNRAIDHRCFWMMWIKADPTFDALRHDNRYALLLRRMNLSSQ